MRFIFYILFIFLFMCWGTCLFAAEKTISTFDMTYLYDLDRNKLSDTKSIWDQSHFIASLQGIVNRKEPKLYVFFVGDNGKNETNGYIDRFWFDHMKSDWLSDYKINEIKKLADLILYFKNDINGLVVYDGNVAATSNVASTVAGADNLLCVRYDKDTSSLYYYLTHDLKIPVKRWLVNKDGSSMFTGKGNIPGSKVKSTGSSKCDAYIWAKINYLDNGKCNPSLMGNFIDGFWIQKFCNSDQGNRVSNNSLTNHDYLIANKGFAFDLSPWDDELPNDDLKQPLGTDYDTLNKIMLSAYNQNKGKVIHLIGFLPWDKKYTSVVGGKYDPAPTEWKYVDIVSCYNGFIDPEALAYSGMANASIFSKFPLKNKYIQKKPTIDDLKVKGLILPDGKVKETTYVSIYVGDYDCAGWLYQLVPTIWENKMRGDFPLGWAIGPHISKRFAYGMDYVRNTATPNDSFIAADGAGGYNNPGHLAEPRKYSGLPSGIEAWKNYSKPLLEQFDLSIIGFLIDGYAPPMNEALWDMHMEIAPDGIGGQKMEHDGVYKDTMPFIRMEGDAIIPDDAYSFADSMNKVSPEFFYIRNVVWSIPSQKEFMDKIKKSLNGNVEFLGPYEFFLLLKYFHTSGQVARFSGNGNIFDYRNNIEITDYSNILSGFDVRDMFNGSFGMGEKNVTIFAPADGNNYFVEWNTISAEALSRIVFRGCPYNDRCINNIVLYGKENAKDNWQTLLNYSIQLPMEARYEIKLDKAVNMKYFRAVFTEAPNQKNRGPRITEIEGYSN